MSVARTGWHAVFVDDDLGPGLISLHEISRRERRVQRRAFPTGRVVWDFDVGSEVTGLDADSGFLHVVTARRELITLNAQDGTVIQRKHIVFGHAAYTPLCVTVAPNGDVLVGTAEGRILVLPPQE